MDSQEANAYTGGYDLGFSASVVGYALLGHTWTTGQDDFGWALCKPRRVLNYVFNMERPRGLVR